MIDIIQISKKVLAGLSAMNYEKDGGSSFEQLIFPMKIQAKGTNPINRISEQELRLLFIEEFKIASSDLFYSIETPTQEKYKFGKTYADIEVNKDGRSASLDMCIFERISNVYNRILNIEFKYRNAVIKNIGKDVLKLMKEKQNGAFILLLDNTNRGTFCNNKGTGVFNKLYKSFTDFQAKWEGSDKSIRLIIISLGEKILIHREINKVDLNNLEKIFFAGKGCGNIEEINGNGWQFKTINKMP